MAGVDSGRRVHALIEVMVALHAIVIVVMKYAIAMAQYNIIRIFTADQATNLCRTAKSAPSECPAAQPPPAFPRLNATTCLGRLNPWLVRW